MVRHRSVFIMASLIALTAGCSTFDSSYDDGPVVFGGTQTGLGVRYDPAKIPASEVDEVAINFCRSYDKKPIRRSKSVLLPNVVYQAYDCVAPVASSVPAAPPAETAPVTPAGNASPAVR